MKKIILLLFNISILQTAYGQLQKPIDNRGYTQITFGIGTHLIGSIGYKRITKKGYSFAVQYAYENKYFTNLPSDYNGYTSGLFGYLFVEEISTVALLVGRVLEAKSQLIRLDLRCGLNYGTIKRPENFRKRTHPIPGRTIRPNYDYEYVKRKFVGVIIHPTIDFTLTRRIGLSLSGRINLNTITPTAGGEVGLIFGNLRGKRKN
jgi:hypothetical protein